MKRDLDLARQLLIDIQGQGPECAVAALRPGAPTEHEERVRCHLRLLIDAGLVKELDRTSGGAPCVRLTNSGHELLELSHSEARWRDAIHLVQERTGGCSLTAVRAVLTRWAVDASLYAERRLPRRAYRGYFHRVEPRHPETRYYDPVDKPVIAERDKTYFYRTNPRYLERFDWREPLDWRDITDRELYAQEVYGRGRYVEDYDLSEEGVSLPIQVI